MTLDRDLVVTALPSYEIGGELGRGGWGVVLQGRHKQLGREVAIKQLPRAFAADPAVRARFVNEARLLAALDHPHIVPVYDFVEHEGLCLLVMEKLGGGTVWSRFAGDGMAMDASCAVALATCAALHFAHGRGVLHRDVKPENLLFSAGEVLKVTDFGIAKVIGGSQTLATRAGDVLGTPAYMAPEQAQAKELSPATDVYAAGMMLYELFSGQLPFDDDGDALALLFRHAFEAPKPLQELAPDVPDAIADVVIRALATDPTGRYPSAEAFGVALAEAATLAWGPGWLGRGGLPVMAAGSIVAATERQSGPVSVAVQASAPPAAASEPPVSRPPVTPPPSARVRPSVAVPARTAAAVPTDEDSLDLVPVNRMLPKLRTPIALILGAAALALVVVLIARIGLGTPAHAGNLERSVMANGTPVSAERVMNLDLGAPVELAWNSAPDKPAVARVVFRLSVAGVTVGERTVDAVPGADGTVSATLDLSTSRLLTAGASTADIEMQDASGTVVGHGSYAVKSTQSRFLTVPGIVTVLLCLFVIAYAESFLRSRRKGKKAVSATVGMVVIGALGGIAVVLVTWVLGAGEPVLSTFVACALVGGAAGLVAVLAASRVARLRRMRAPARTEAVA